MEERTPLTMKDIAAHFGISVATVSRALKDSPRISVERRAAIQQYAREHNFTPNMIAESLRHSRIQPMKVIGVIIPEFAHYYFSSILSGIEEEASAHGYRIMVAQSNEQYEREVKICKSFYENKVCGIIVSQAKDTHRYDHFQQLTISNKYTKMLNHKLRTEEDAILVGHTTAEREHPKLTVHHWFGPDPKRVILTSHRPLLQVIDDLYQQGIQSLIVEGGLKTHEAFIAAGLWDEIHVETNHQLTVTNGTQAPHLPSEAQFLSQQNFGHNTLITYKR